MSDNTVDSMHPQYEFYSSVWKKNTDFIKGAKSVKECGEEYLPNPNKNAPALRASNSNYIDYDYKYYKDSAPFLALASYSHQTLSSAINRKPIDSTGLSKGLEYLLEDANGDGLGLNQLVSMCVDEVVKNARVGLLTELVSTGGKELSMADNEAGAMPRIKIYCAEAIRNWDDNVHGQTMVNLDEWVQENPDALFGSDYELQHRVLLMQDGKYIQRIYPDNASNENYEDINVTYNGKSFDYIPFNFIGRKNNDSDCDESLMTPIVDLNQTHYINSALDQNITSQCSFIGTFISSGMDSDDVKATFPNGLNMGSSMITFLPENSQVLSIQAEYSNAAREKCLQAVNDAVSIGAKIIMEGGTNTATEAVLDSVSETATLTQIAINVENAINAQLANISMVLGISEESFIIVNKETSYTALTAQDRVAWQRDIELGNVSLDDYLNAMRKAGLIPEDRTNEDIKNDTDDSSINNSRSNTDA